jgi:hypothetical protein
MMDLTTMNSYQCMKCMGIGDFGPWMYGHVLWLHMRVAGSWAVELTVLTVTFSYYNNVLLTSNPHGL